MGTPKTDILLPNGDTMMTAVIATLREVCAEVVVVGAKYSGHRSIADRRAGAGPLGGIEALLASGLDETYLVCPIDVPLITSELLYRLTSPRGPVATIFEIEGESRIQSLPVRISASALEAAVAALDAGHNAVHALLARLDIARVPISRDEASALKNVNTPDDYNNLI